MSIRHAVFALVSVVCFGCAAPVLGSTATGRTRLPPPGGISPMSATDTGAMAAGPTGSVPAGTSLTLPPTEEAIPAGTRQAGEQVRPAVPARVAEPERSAARTASPGPVARTPAPPARIDVTPGAPGTEDDSLVNDEDVTRGVRVALDRDPHLSEQARNVLVTTHDGVVTISGQVPSANERDRIEADARAVAGVARLENQVRVAH